MLSCMRKLMASPRMRMLLVGALSVVLAYAAFLTLITLGVHYLVASVANFVTYLLVNFSLNRAWAFKSQGNVKRQAAAHAGLHLGNQLLIMAGLYVLVEFVLLSPAWSQIIMQIIVFLTVFTLTPIIFKHK